MHIQYINPDLSLNCGNIAITDGKYIFETVWSVDLKDYVSREFMEKLRETQSGLITVRGKGNPIMATISTRKSRGNTLSSEKMESVLLMFEQDNNADKKNM